MRRVTLSLLCVVAMTLMLAVNVTAASPHFKKGGSPTCDVTGTQSSKTVVCEGTLAGLGNEDLLIESTLSGFTVYQCENQGGNIAPGQNKVLEGPQTVPTLIESDAIKNGNVRFVTNPNTLSAEPTVSAEEAGCPNPNWTGLNPTLTLTDIVLTISQGGVRLFTCTASDPDGLFGNDIALTC